MPVELSRAKPIKRPKSVKPADYHKIVTKISRDLGSDFGFIVEDFTVLMINPSPQAQDGLPKVCTRRHGALRIHVM